MKNAGLWLLLALIWSTSYLVIKIGVAHIPPLSLVALRMVIGTVLMWGILFVLRLKMPRDLLSWLVFLVSGLFGNVIPFSLISYGEQSVDSGLAALTMGIAPVVTVLLAPLFHSAEILTRRAIFGILIGFGGLIVMNGPSALSDVGQQVLPQLAILGAALCYAFTTLFARRYALHPPLVTTAGSMAVGTVVIIVAALLFDPVTDWQALPVSAILAGVYLGVFPAAIGTLIYFYLVPKLGAARLSQVNFVVPVAGALLGVAVLGEALPASTLIAMGLILLAVWLVTSR